MKRKFTVIIEMPNRATVEDAHLYIEDAVVSWLPGAPWAFGVIIGARGRRV